jgi:hypothetical protein
MLASHGSTVDRTMLSVIMLSVIMLSVIMLSVIMLSVANKTIILSVAMLSVVMLSVVAPAELKNLKVWRTLKGSTCPTNIRLGQKWLAVSNTLA